VNTSIHYRGGKTVTILTMILSVPSAVFCLFSDTSRLSAAIRMLKHYYFVIQSKQSEYRASCDSYVTSKCIINVNIIISLAIHDADYLFH